MNLPSRWFDRLWSSLRYASIATRRAIWHRYHASGPHDASDQEETTATSEEHIQLATLPLSTSWMSQHETKDSSSVRRSCQAGTEVRGSATSVECVSSQNDSETNSLDCEERRGSRFWLWLVGLRLGFVQLVKRVTSWEFATVTGVIAAILALIFLITTEFTGRPKQLVAAADPQIEATPEPIPGTEEKPLEPVSTPIEQPEEADFPDFGDLFPEEEDPVPEPTELEPRENPFEFASTPEPEPEPELEIEASVQFTDPEPILIANSVPVDESFDNSPVQDDLWTRMPFSLREGELADTRLPAAYETPQFLLRASRFGIRSDKPPTSGDHEFDFEITKTHRPSIVSQDVVECTIQVTSHSEATVTGASIRESIPAEITVTECEPLGVLADGELSWELEPLGPGESKTLTYQYFGTSEATTSSKTTLATTAKVEVVTQITGMKLNLQLSTPRTVATNELLRISFDIANDGEVESSDLLLRLHLPPTLEHPYGQILDHEVAAIAAGRSHRAILHVRPVSPTSAAEVRAEIIHESEVIDSTQISTRIVSATPNPSLKKKVKPKATKKLSVPEAPCWCVPPSASAVAPARILR